MNILFACSEVTPFAKTGGLADVGQALPAALHSLQQEVTVVMPAYRGILRQPELWEPLGIELEIPVASRLVRGSVLQARPTASPVPMLFIRQDEYFDREELYRAGGEDFPDNCARFAFFSRAVLELIRRRELGVDVVHCHDWQTGLIPAYLKTDYRHTPGYEKIKSLLTIHNLAYQGLFAHWDMLLTGLDWKYFNWQQMEFYGKVNLLKTGLVFADGLTTVSRRYAEEIQTEEFGCGLEGVLRDRRDVLKGIVNGVHYETWDPRSDPHLVQPYDVRSWQAGKAACKAALQEKLGLPVDPAVPVIGLVGRLADQKGWDLVGDVMRQWVSHRDVQWVIVGTGEVRYHELLRSLAVQRPDRVAARFEFSERLAHEVEAGADLFLMPSRYEPCGLNQLYSMRYGTVPVVRGTGGLYDTVCDATPENLASGVATGFRFSDYSVDDLRMVLERALETYLQQPEVWAKLVRAGMSVDWSWKKSAEEYLAVYRDLVD